MPSYENSFNQADYAVSQTPISQMTRGQCEAEEASILSHIERLERAYYANDPRSGLVHGSDAKRVILQRIVELRNQTEALQRRIRTLDEWDHAVFGQNAGHGSTSRNRSSQSPSGPRAPNTSAQR